MAERICPWWAGYLLARAFGFENEIAAGVVLIGSCPGGVASNLMAYLAKGNVALSVTMTACSTLMSPLATPYLMYFFGGQFIEVKILDMMIAIINLIIVPIVAGLLVHQILYGRKRLLEKGEAVGRRLVVGCEKGREAPGRLGDSASLFLFENTLISGSGSDPISDKLK